MSDQGKANYEAYRKLAGRPGVSAHPLPDYEQLPLDLRYAFDAGADAVEAWLADAPVDEDAPGNEPKPAKVVVVTEHSGRKRRFAASRFAMADNGQLAIGEPIGDDAPNMIDPVAGLNVGRWADVAYEGAELAGDDSTAKALDIAKKALTEIVRRSGDGGALPFGRPEIGGIAADALNSIWNETEA